MNLLKVSDFNNKQKLISLFSQANSFKQNIEKKEKIDIFQNKILANLFFEPSTRSRISFEAAMLKLGGTVISPDKDALSCIKGESISETIKTVSHYVDIIVVRSALPFTEWLISEGTFSASKVPIINAGDGIYNHPTQALIDLYTIWNNISDFPQGLNIGIVGDMKHSRTIRSFLEIINDKQNNVFLLDNVDNSSFKSDKSVSPGKFIELLPDLDILYLNRIQRERWNSSSSIFKLTTENSKILKKNCMIMNPGPRQEELLPKFDNICNNLYWKCVENGLYLRMALLKHFLTP